MNKITIEACVNSVESVLAAEKGGADRVELCDNLYEGGTTPSAASILLAKKLSRIRICVIIRPRGGDFCYSDLEFEIMKQDVLAAKELEAEGVVIGILKVDGSIDVERMAELEKLARPMEVVCHRAFDMSTDPFDSLEKLIEIGVDRILTSGTKNKATEGKEIIKQLVEKAGDRITIMPGSGMTEENIAEMVQYTGAKQFHVSCREPIESEMIFRREGVFMGGLSQIPEFKKKITDPDRIALLVKRANEAASGL
jgi:copper homeostasis protein